MADFNIERQVEMDSVDGVFGRLVDYSCLTKLVLPMYMENSLFSLRQEQDDFGCNLCSSDHQEFVHTALKMILLCTLDIFYNVFLLRFFYSAIEEWLEKGILFFLSEFRSFKRGSRL